MTVVLIVVGVCVVSLVVGVLIGRSADRMGIPDDGEPSGPRVRIEGRR